MGTKTIPFKTSVVIILLSLLTLLSVSTASDWETVTSFRDIRSLEVVGNDLYIVSSGGLLIISDSITPPSLFKNLDGLQTNDLTDITVDSSGTVWISAYGRLIRFENGVTNIFPTAPLPIRLLSVISDGDLLWCGSDSGLVLYSKTGIDGGGWRNRYRITSVNSFPSVYDVFLDSNLIWLATSAGLAVADRSDPTALSAPSAWKLFNLASNPEMGSSDVQRVVRFEDSIHIITNDSLFRMSITPVDTNFVAIPIWNNPATYDIRLENSSLTVYHNLGITQLQSGSLTTVPTSGIPSGRTTGTIFKGSRYVAASGGNGLFVEQSGGSFSEYRYGGLPGNNVTDVVTVPNGIGAGGFSNKLAATFDGQTWSAIPYSPAFFSTVLREDDIGNLWIGTQGGGLWRYDDSTLLNYNDSNSTIVGNNDNPPSSFLFSWVTGLQIQNNILYASLFKAYTSYPVAYARLDNNGLPTSWDSLGAADGITSVNIVDIDVHDTVIALASDNSGVYYCVLGPDPFDKTDDYCVNFTTSNSFILSDVVRVASFSPDGELWVGTNFGVSRLDESLGQAGEIGRFVDLSTPSGFGSDITAIEFDSRGNAWIGSTRGLVRFGTSFGSFELFQTANSDLVSDTITNLTVEPLTGDVYISTPSGVSIFRSSSGVLTGELDAVVAFPNPFLIRSETDRLQFNFAKLYTIQIFNVNGELVWGNSELTDQSWDGRNQDGKQVASGVYLYLLADSDGNSVRGKVLLVRQ